MIQLERRILYRTTRPHQGYRIPRHSGESRYPVIEFAKPIELVTLASLDSGFRRSDEAEIRYAITLLPPP